MGGDVLGRGKGEIGTCKGLHFSLVTSCEYVKIFDKHNRTLIRETIVMPQDRQSINLQPVSPTLS